MKKRKSEHPPAPAVVPATLKAPPNPPLILKNLTKNLRSGKRGQKSKKRNRRRNRTLKGISFVFLLYCPQCERHPVSLSEPWCFHRSEPESAEEKEQEELVTSTVRPEEIPPIPENRFLMRRSPQTVQKPKEEAEKEQRNKEERPRERLVLTLTNIQTFLIYYARVSPRKLAKAGGRLEGRPTSDEAWHRPATDWCQCPIDNRFMT